MEEVKAEQKLQQYKKLKLFVGGLSEDATESDVEEYFTQFGKIRNIYLIFDYDTKKSRGFGFVEFIEEADVDKVLSTKDHKLKGQQIKVKRMKLKKDIREEKQKEKDIESQKPKKKIKKKKKAKTDGVRGKKKLKLPHQSQNMSMKNFDEIENNFNPSLEQIEEEFNAKLAYRYQQTSFNPQANLQKLKPCQRDRIILKPQLPGVYLNSEPWKLEELEDEGNYHFNYQISKFNSKQAFDNSFEQLTYPTHKLKLQSSDNLAEFNRNTTQILSQPGLGDFYYQKPAFLEKNCYDNSGYQISKDNSNFVNNSQKSTTLDLKNRNFTQKTDSVKGTMQIFDQDDERDARSEDSAEKKQRIQVENIISKILDE